MLVEGNQSLKPVRRQEHQRKTLRREDNGNKISLILFLRQRVRLKQTEFCKTPLWLRISQAHGYKLEQKNRVN